MNVWKRTSISYNLLGAFILAMVIFAFFDGYLIVAAEKSQSLSLALEQQYGILNELSGLSHNNDALNDAVKSYVITKDPMWQTRYDTTAASINSLFKDMGRQNLAPFEQSTITGLENSIQATEQVALVIFARTATSTVDASGTDQLFEDMYVSRQNYIAQTIDGLVAERASQGVALITQNEISLAALHDAMLALFAALAIIFILTWLGVYNGLLRPLKNLTIAIKKIGSGGRNEAIAVEGPSEIGQLAQAFEDMSTKVEDAYNVLSRERSQLLASINSLPLGFVMLDINGNAIVANQAAEKLFHEKAISLQVITACFGDAPKIDDHFRHVVATKGDHEIPEVVFNDRSYRMLITPIILVTSNNEVIGAVILLEDITEQKRLEHSKGAFVAIASHEMRTPLTVIRGNAELMLDEPGIKENAILKPQVSDILRSSIRMLSIVNDFLDIQNLEESKIALRIEPVDIVKALEETISDLTKIAAQKGLAIHFDAAAVPAFPILQLDKYRLQQIYMNLISNSIHYTDQGSITVTVEKDNDVAKVFVTDTGIGMEPEAQKHLFHRFETGKTFLRSREYGSGMGLYISRILARMMGGDLVLVKSDLGSGSTFGVIIPLVPKNGIPPAEGQQKAVLEIGGTEVPRPGV